jgi:hypothetical protein
MEKLEYEVDTLPKHVAHFLRQQVQEKAILTIEKAEARHMDDDEMREIEAGQTFP